MEEVVIVAGARTAVGAFNGAFASLPAHQLGKVAIEAALGRAKIEAGEVSEVILGQVLTAAQGQNPARQAAIAAGLPIGAPAWGINMVCGSGLRAVALGAQAIRNGDSRIVVAGGQESMSQSTHAAYLRAGQKMGDLNFIDTMIKDGLWDAFNGYHMGNTAENVAREWQITREDQDRFAVASQNKAEAAKKAGRFKDEIAPVTVKNRKGETIVDTDEYIRDGATFEAMTGLRPAFAKDGTVTAGNASGINDGAAALVLMSAERARAEGRPVLGRITAWGGAARAPVEYAIAPADAVRVTLGKAGLSVKDVDLWEINEAFAVVAVANNRLLGLDPEAVNVRGGAVALGHPIGASGARILVTLLHAMKDLDKRRGLASICIGGGEALALVVER